MYSLYYSPIARKLGLAKTTDWGCALRKVTNGFDTILKGGKGIPFDVINNTDEYWFADPLLFSDDSRTWLFVEAFNNKARKGEIGVFDIIDGKAQNFHKLIQTSTHMSYPFVFKYHKDFYMIPETGAAGHIALYKAKDFPYDWDVDTILLEGSVYRDTTVIKNGDGTITLLSYKQEGTNRFNQKNTFTIFSLDMEKKKIVKVQELVDKRKVNRPAGPCFEVDGKIYRVSQKCNRAYGEAMFVYQIKQDGKFDNDTIVNLFDGSNIHLSTGGKVVLTHTYSQAGGYEVIDFRCLL